MKKILSLLIMGFAIGSVNAATEINMEPNPQIVTKSIFGQKITFTLPENFKEISESIYKDGYEFKAVPKNQTENNYSEIIVISGQKDIATAPEYNFNNTFIDYLENQSKACPGEFYVHQNKLIKINTNKTLSAVFRCSALLDSQKKPYTETTVVDFINGEKDLIVVKFTKKSELKGKLTSQTFKEFEDLGLVITKEQNIK